MVDGFTPRALVEAESRAVRMRGISVNVPRGWEARIRVDAPNDDGVVLPVLHAATVPLIVERGDYGAGVVESLRSGDVFLGMVEFGSEAVGSALFAPVSDVPRAIVPSDFHPKQLQRVIPGQAGVQKFFTVRDRAFCLYVVIGSYALVETLAAKTAVLLSGIEIVEETAQ